MAVDTKTSFTDQDHQDKGKASSILNAGLDINNSTSSNNIGDRAVKSDLYKLALHGSNIFQRDEIRLYNKIYRFGLVNPYNAVSTTREYLFFTKPDLNIIGRDNLTGSFTRTRSNGQVVTNELTDDLYYIPFWKDLFSDRLNTIRMLQNSFNPGWNILLQNSVISNLEIPGIEGTVIDSPVNDYGVGFQYRGTSEASDDSLEFALEFKDSKWLDIYYFFKAYEEYEILKHHGTVTPWEPYIVNRILHDQFAIYKFVVGDDMETLLYWGKLYGVMPMNLPREVFSQADFTNGLSYSINFKAAFFEDMKKDILIEFNDLSKSFAAQNNINPNDLLQYETYNSSVGMSDFRPATYAYIAKYKSNYAPGGFVYKLKWKGDVEF